MNFTEPLGSRIFLISRSSDKITARNHFHFILTCACIRSIRGKAKNNNNKFVSFSVTWPFEHWKEQNALKAVVFFCKWQTFRNTGRSSFFLIFDRRLCIASFTCWCRWTCCTSCRDRHVLIMASSDSFPYAQQQFLFLSAYRTELNSTNDSTNKKYDATS